MPLECTKIKLYRLWNVVQNINVSNFEAAPPRTILTLDFFNDFCGILKNMVFGDAFWKLETFIRILNHVSRSTTCFPFTFKASNLVKWLLSTWYVMGWCQCMDCLKFKTCPSSPRNFGLAYDVLTVYKQKILIKINILIHDRITNLK